MPQALRDHIDTRLLTRQSAAQDPDYVLDEEFSALYVEGDYILSKDSRGKLRVTEGKEIRGRIHSLLNSSYWKYLIDIDTCLWIHKSPLLGYLFAFTWLGKTTTSVILAPYPVIKTTRKKKTIEPKWSFD